MRSLPSPRPWLPRLPSPVHHHSHLGAIPIETDHSELGTSPEQEFRRWRENPWCSPHLSQVVMLQLMYLCAIINNALIMRFTLPSVIYRSFLGLKWILSNTVLTLDIISRCFPVFHCSNDNELISLQWRLKSDWCARFPVLMVSIVAKNNSKWWKQGVSDQRMTVRPPEQQVRFPH